MQFFVGIDVSLEMSSICIIDERGVIIKEGKTASDPHSIAKFMRHRGRKGTSVWRPDSFPSGSLWD